MTDSQMISSAASHTVAPLRHRAEKPRKHCDNSYQVLDTFNLGPLCANMDETPGFVEINVEGR